MPSLAPDHVPEIAITCALPTPKHSNPATLNRGPASIKALAQPSLAPDHVLEIAIAHALLAPKHTTNASIKALPLLAFLSGTPS